MSAADPPFPMKVFHLPKRGNSEAEYEDAFAGDVVRGRFAIADGASEASYADVWARLLVEQFVRFPQAGLQPWSAWLPTIQQRWQQQVHQQSLPWYTEVKVEQGA